MCKTLEAAVTALAAATRAMLTSLAAHLLVRLIEEDVVDARRVLEVHGAVAQLQVVLLAHPGSRSTASLAPRSRQKQPNPEVVLQLAARSHASGREDLSRDAAAQSRESLSRG